MIIYIGNFTAPGTYTLGAEKSGRSVTHSDERGLLGEPDHQLNVYFTSASNTGTVTVNEFDTASRTIAGTFSFSAEEEVRISAKVVHVTGGSFQGHYEQ